MRPHKRRSAITARNKISESQNEALFNAKIIYGGHYYPANLLNECVEMSENINENENNIHSLSFLWLPRHCPQLEGNSANIGVPTIWGDVDDALYIEEASNLMYSHCDFFLQELKSEHIKSSYQKSEYAKVIDFLKKWKQDKIQNDKKYVKGQLVLLNRATVEFATQSPVAKIRSVQRRKANMNIFIGHMKQSANKTLKLIPNTSGYIDSHDIVKILGANDNTYELAAPLSLHRQEIDNNESVFQNNMSIEDIRAASFKEMAITDLHQTFIYLANKMYANLCDRVNKRHAFKFHFERYSLNKFEWGGQSELERLSMVQEKQSSNVILYKNISWKSLLQIIGPQLLKRRYGGNTFTPAQIDIKYELNTHKLTMFYLCGRLDDKGIPWCNIPITYEIW